eukprot:m.24836 g.24836  ORF g.24836 m.24836 type:complete len:60 (+) comp28685_c0_seq2:34-213(+)
MSSVRRWQPAGHGFEARRLATGRNCPQALVQLCAITATHAQQHCTACPEEHCVAEVAYS